jgi:hypothetical protein
MPHWQQQFHTQAEYYLQLAELAVSPEDRVQLITIACEWHRLAQENRRSAILR